MPSEQAIITPNHELTETVATLGGRRHVICSTNDNKHDPPASESGEDDLEYDTEEEQGNEEAVARSVGLDTVINGDAEEPDRDNAADVENDDKVGMHGEAVTEIDSEDEEEDSYALECLLTSYIPVLGVVDDRARTAGGSENAIVHKDDNVDNLAEKHHITFTSRKIPTEQSRGWPKRGSSLGWRNEYPIFTEAVTGGESSDYTPPGFQT